MKITCQACQSKYTIADDKIQGKVAKIRCKKCGATVLVDASAASSGEAALAPTDVAQGGAENVAGVGMWSVAIGEGEPRSMTLQDVVDAYNTGTITSETYVWKDGMADWLMLAQCDEIASVLRRAANGAPVVPEHPEQAALPVQSSETGAGAGAKNGAPAVRRDPTRARAGDIFAGGSEDEEIATSVPPNVVARAASAAAARSAAAAASSSGSGATTATTSSSSAKGPDEQSLLFSLSALTSNKNGANGASSSSGSKKSNEDSGLIDLNALAKAQESHKASGASEMSAMASPLFPTPFLFPAALGTPEVPPEEVDAPQKKKSKAPIIALGVAAVACVVGLVAVLSSRGTDSVAVAPPPEVTVTPPPPDPTPAQTADPTPSAATAQSSATKKVAAPGGGGVRKRPGAAGGPEAPAVPAAAAPAQPAGPQRGKCGCLASDLQCQIRCSATGK